MAKQQLEAYSIIAREPGGLKVLEKVEITPGTPGKDQILVRHTAVGVNFIDIYIRSGLYPWPVDKNLVLGCEAAGVIEAVGEGVDNFAKGERVAYTIPNGAYTTHRVMDTGPVVKLPDSVDDKTAAAAMLKGLTAHYLLNSSYPCQKGDTVLFHAAAGGVGLIAGQWLKHKGIKAIGTAGGPEKCALAKANGYAHVIDYKKDDFAEEVMKLTDGKGVEAVYDSVGRDTIPGSIKCLKKFGSLISFGQASGAVPDFKITDLAVNSLYLQRPTLFHYAADRGWLDSAADDLFKLISDGTVNIAINQEFPLSEAGNAHTALEGRQTTGCTVLMP